MKIKAKVSFCGAFSMAAGETRVCNNQVLVADLLRAGYAVIVDEPEPVKPKRAEPEPEPAAIEKKPAKKRSTKKAG